MRENVTSLEVYQAILEAVSVAQQRIITMKKNRLPPMTSGPSDVHEREHIVHRGGKTYREQAHTRKARPKKAAAPRQRLIARPKKVLLPKGDHLNGDAVMTAMWADIADKGEGGIWLLPDGSGVNVGFAGHQKSVREGMESPPGISAYDYAGSFGYVHVSIGWGECNLDTWKPLTVAQRGWLNDMFTRAQAHSRKSFRETGRTWSINASVHHILDKWIRVTLGAANEQQGWDDFINSSGVIEEGK